MSTVQARLNTFLAERAPRRSDWLHTRSIACIAAARQFQQALYEAGLAGPTWPREYGGLELTSAEQALYAIEMDKFMPPVAELTLGLSVCGPAVLHFGTDAQRAQHGRATLRGDHVWCQLWSEPDAGSDLASVRTSAVRTEEGDWIVTGRKVWTSGAHYADYGLLLVRTETEIPRHRGLSMFILDMTTAGVTVRPLTQMTGRAEFNEVTLDHVRIPADAMLGERAGGWRIMTWMMGHERTSVGMNLRDPLMIGWDELITVIRNSGQAGDSVVRDRLAELQIRLRAAQLLNMRINQEVAAGTASIVLGSAAKVSEALALRDAAEFAYEVVGASAWAETDEMSSRVADAVLQSPAYGVGGGTEEVQLNALGERVLGLPKESL
ncbi:acyl-CoA dehydrogenase family protein [Nocardia sp. R6R-6]|uniref:acyl-CoA dehydrogenase family protein n=1 Tax=Nocardia sp. R6R-6 TaxID=3459303 RepID=UPI00403D877B